jgi:hypothetical protein
MGLTKEHFAIIVNSLVRKIQDDELTRLYISTHPNYFEYESNFLAFSYDGKLVKFIDLLSEFYLTCDERIGLLDELLEEAREVMKKAHQSEAIMDYYLSKIDNL